MNGRQDRLLVTRREQEILDKYLPRHLRCDHWYNDLHHTMLLILFADLKKSVAKGHSTRVEYYLDTLTIYWIIHCLMEEEGFSHAILNGVVSRELAAEHATAHKKLLIWWADNVVKPFKAGDMAIRTMGAVAEEFLGLVLQHIETMDMTTYGADSDRAKEQIISEVAHIAISGLPLSPYMKGSVSMITSLLPEIAATLAPKSLAPNSRAPLGPLRLSAYGEQLCNEARVSLRDMLVSHATYKKCA